jgi:hypothetical protein
MKRQTEIFAAVTDFARARTRPGFAILACSLLCAGMVATFAETPDLQWLDRDVLDRGELQVETDSEGPLGRVTARVALIIKAPPETIWDVLTACEIAPEYVPNVISCELLETIDEGRAQIFVQSIRAVFFLPRFEHVFRLDYQPYERIDVTRISGPLGELQGFWLLLPQADGAILLMHQLELDPGTPIPRFMVRARLRRDLPRALEALRERSEAQHR